MIFRRYLLKLIALYHLQNTLKDSQKEEALLCFLVINICPCIRFRRRKCSIRMGGSGGDRSRQYGIYTGEYAKKVHIFHNSRGICGDRHQISVSAVPSPVK